MTDTSAPASRCCRRRRATFSTPTTASSITTASATASPANEIALKLSPIASSTSAAATSDTGIVISAISTVRHWNRKAASNRDSSTAAITIASVRLSIASSMKVAGRKTDVSVCIPERPGWSFSSAFSTSFVTSSVLAPGNFSTTSISPSLSFTTASPISGWWSSTTFATSVRRSRPPVPSTGTLPSSAGVAMLSNTLRTWSRCCGVSMNPPVPGVDASR